MRFAGSAVDFTPSPSGVSTGSYSGAAGAVDLGAGFASMRDKAPRFDQLSAEAMKNQSAEKISAMDAEADVMSAGITSMVKPMVRSWVQKEGSKRPAQADAQKQSAMFGALGGIASTGLKLFNWRPW